MAQRSPLTTSFVCYTSDRYILYYYPPRGVLQNSGSTGVGRGGAYPSQGSSGMVLPLRPGTPVPKV
jgi:hypothetical protein